MRTKASPTPSCPTWKRPYIAIMFVIEFDVKKRNCACVLAKKSKVFHQGVPHGRELVLLQRDFSIRGSVGKQYTVSTVC